MKIFGKTFGVFIGILVSIFSFGQIKQVGIPSIVNHPPALSGASTQNWAIAQSYQGFMYFGNNDGVLEYDGTNWTMFSLQNQLIIRSVLALGDTIFVGAFEQFGFFAPDSSGKLKYNSLKHLVPNDFRAFDEIWKIYKHQEKIYFQSFNYIFIYYNGKIEVIQPMSSFGFLFLVNNEFYAVDDEQGLMLLNEGTLTPVFNHPVFSRNEIRCILPFENRKLLIGTSNEGLFVFDGQKLSSWDTRVNDLLNTDNLFSAIKLNDGNYAFGTVRDGLYLSNNNGDVLQHINRYKGLQNNTILSLFQDSKNNLWLGLDNGISFVETSSPLSFLDFNFNIESVYASIVHNDILYVGTNQGLYAAKFSEIYRTGSDGSKFGLIKGTEGQVWHLEVIDNTLFCGHNFGCFIVEGFSAKQVSDVRGFWSFLKPPQPENTIIAGTYTGLSKLLFDDAGWVFGGEVRGFRESSRSIFLDKSNFLWVSHGYKGLFQLQLSESLDQVANAQLFINRSGLTSELPYNIQVIDNEMLVTTKNGIFKFDYDRQVFVPYNELNILFEGKGFIDKIHQDEKGNFWYFTNQYLGLMRLLEDGTYRDITAPFSRINDNLLPAFENIFIYDDSNVFIGSQKGLIHYDPTIINDYRIIEDVILRETTFYGKGESLTFFLKQASSHQKNNKITIPYSINSVVFRFTIPAFESPNAIRFSYRLEGFEDKWSEWDGINFKEYTNLREGSYTFEVKALNAFGLESHIKSFVFSVNPPFLRSNTAYAIYFITLLLIFAGNIYYIRKRIIKIRLREKIKHEKSLAKSETIFMEKTALSEKEIINLRNEGLKKEMEHKNKELANATLHLIQKNRTLTSIKNELTKLQKNNFRDKPEGYVISSFIKKLNKDIGNKKNWELFNQYFDEVHQDFINRVKTKHENLTPRELRLCAYLRMNISTKEIAPLMNISIRGVEISRYRLRTKMNLERNTNLTEYIMSF